MALLIVLGMLVLLSVIVLAFIESVTKDLGDSRAYESEVNTRMLADSVLNLVEMQIRVASTGTGQAWISQPGLLRTFGTSGTVAYKLYSASRMVDASGTFDPNAGTDLPPSASGTAWLNQPNYWTDLNSPVASGTTTTGSASYIFPIIDGNGIQSLKLGGATQFTYSTDGTIPTIEGFATKPSQVGITYSGSAYSGTAAFNPVPMPVQWLYMLKDGTLIPATVVPNSKDVQFNGTVLPTGTNPIVARIAFWTDDESCKVNVNTASEGTFWDTPVCNTQPNIQNAGFNDPVGTSTFDPNQIFEWDLAVRQPCTFEYQRYPGHPATTCLSPILGDTILKAMVAKSLLTGVTSTGQTSNPSQTGYSSNYGYHTLTGSNWAKFCEFEYQLAPRVSGSDAIAAGSDYSSRAGTYRPGLNTITASTTNLSLASYGSGTNVTYDNDRLYATVDDYFFTGTLPPNGTSRAPNGYQISGSTSYLTPSLLSKARFFLTANSNAPELNVFNLPRVCIWPITRTAATLNGVDISGSVGGAAVASTMTPFDKVIAFDATVGMNGTNSVSGTIPFYFTRYDPFSQTNDYANSTNNQNLYAYLYNFLQTPFPGLSSGANATFARKYPNEDMGSVASGGNQILTEMYDYIRCTNLADCSADGPTGTIGVCSYTYVNPTASWQSPSWNGLTSEGQVVPIVIPPSAVVSGTQAGAGPTGSYTRGIGRIILPGEMTMDMVKEDERIKSTDTETATENSIVVSSALSQYSGTWGLNKPQANNVNVLLKETSPPSIYQAGTNNGKTPPTQDVLLLPGAGGLSASGTGGPNTYDPRTQTKVQIALLPFYFCPMAGTPAIGNNIRLHWTGVKLTFTGTDGHQATAVTPGPSGTYPNGTQGQDLYDSGRVETQNSSETHIGGAMGPKSLIDTQTSTPGYIPSNAGAPLDSMPQVLEVVVAGTSGPTFSGTSSGTMNVAGSGTLQVVAPAVPVTWAARGINDSPSVIQTMVFSWPQTTVQIPSLPQTADPTGLTSFPFVALQGTSANSTYSGNPATAESMVITATNAGGVNVKTGTSRLAPNVTYQQGYNTYLLMSGSVGAGAQPHDSLDILRSLPLSGTLQKSSLPIAGDFRIVAASGSIPASWYQPIKTYSASGTFMQTPINMGSYVKNPFTASGTTTYYDKTKQYAYGWKICSFNGAVWPRPSSPGELVSSGSTGTVSFIDYADNRFAPYVPEGVIGAYNAQGAPGDWDNGSGWLADGAYCNKPDEGWIRHVNFWPPPGSFAPSTIAPFIGTPYASEDASLPLPSLFSPNKEVSSPVMFGSLPTGVMAQHPWQTLLFRPAKSYLPGGSSGAASSSAVHPGAGVSVNASQTGIASWPYTTLPDHALLDLFWMPVVEPYPISEPFATSGKVNLNYQIAPFTYITRNTALRAVLQSVKITALNPTIVDNIFPTQNPPPPPGTTSIFFSHTYKFPGSYGGGGAGAGSGGGAGVCVRRNIDIDDTLKEIDYLRFGFPAGMGSGASVNKPFITASEICDVPLIPADLPNQPPNVTPYNINSRIQNAQPADYDAILSDFWYGNLSNTTNSAGSPPQFGHRLTGDNSLERPYSMIYPRLTTKSNTYTVYVRVQTLHKSATAPATIFKDGVDQVTGEFRGSFVIERYLDPATTGFYLSGTTPVSMSTPGAQLGPYKFRIVTSKQFAQ